MTFCGRPSQNCQRCRQRRLRVSGQVARASSSAILMSAPRDQILNARNSAIARDQLARHVKGPRRNVPGIARKLHSYSEMRMKESFDCRKLRMRDRQQSLRRQYDGHRFPMPLPETIRFLGLVTRWCWADLCL